MLFALKYTLPFTGVTQAAQIVILLLAITGFAWFFWWNCTPDRRGVGILLLTVWAAGLMKIVRL